MTFYYRKVIQCFWTAPFSKRFFALKRKDAFLNSSGLKSVIEKLRFRDRSMWMVGLTVEIKLSFQTSPA